MGSKQYLEFISAEYSKTRKTKVFHIFNVETGDFIGKIKWSCEWRQYVSEIETGAEEFIIFSAGCHIQVAEFIKELMDERKTATEIFKETLLELAEGTPKA